MKYKQKIAIFFLLFFLSFAAFHRTLSTGFIWDDNQMIVENPYNKTINFHNLKHNFLSNAFNQPQNNFYRPLQIISYMFDFSVWKLNPFGYHLVNFILHFLNACLIFELLLILGFPVAIALMTAAYFSLNPPVVEQLIIIAGRAEIMTLTWTLLSIILFLKQKTFFYLLSILCFVLSLLSKESGVITPFIILACLWYKNEWTTESCRELSDTQPKQQIRNRSFNLKKLSVFFLIIPFYLWLRHLAVGPLVLHDTGILALGESIIKLPIIIADYIYRTLFPFHLHSHHMQSENNLLLSFAVFCLLLLSVFYSILKKNRAVILGIMFYVLFLGPKVPLLVTGSFMLDHWVYPSNMGLFLIISYLQHPYLTSTFTQVKKKFILLINIIYVLFLIVVLNINIKNRNSDIKIYEHAIKYKTSDQVHYNLAREYHFTGDYDRALKNLEFVCKRHPENEMFLNGYALVLAKTGNMQKAEEILNKLLGGNPQFSGTFDNMAYILEFKNNRKQSMETLKKGIEKFPEDEKLKTHLARLFLSSNRKEQAEKLLEEVLELNPYNVETLINLGVFAAEKNDFKNAERFWKKAQAIDPKNPALNKNLTRLKETFQNR